MQNSKYLTTAIAYSYVSYIHEYLGLLNNSLYFSTIYFDEETHQLQERLKEIYLELPTLLSDISSEKEARIHELLSLRTSVENKYRVLHAYKRELTHLMTLRQNDYALSDAYLEAMEITDEEISTIDFKQLEADCTQFIFSQKTEKNLQLHAAAVLPYIPIKITKDNFLYYVQKSISHIDIEDTKESAKLLTSILKQLFDGTSNPHYGNSFKDIDESLKELKSTEEADAFFESAELLEETLDSLLKMIHSMFKMICSLGNLFIFDKLDFTELTEMHVSFFDFYHALKNILRQEKDSHLLLYTLPERVEDVYKEYETLFAKSLTKAKADPLFNLMKTYLQMDLSSLFSFRMVKNKTYNSEVQSAVKDFIAELKAELNVLPANERKLRMQYMLSALPFVMSEANFKAYIEQAFSHTLQPRRQFFIASMLQQALEQGGFYGKVPDESEAPVIETLETTDSDGSYIY